MTYTRSSPKWPWSSVSLRHPLVSWSLCCNQYGPSDLGFYRFELLIFITNAHHYFVAKFAHPQNATYSCVFTVLYCCDQVTFEIGRYEASRRIMITSTTTTYVFRGLNHDTSEIYRLNPFTSIDTKSIWTLHMVDHWSAIYWSQICDWVFYRADQTHRWGFHQIHSVKRSPRFKHSDQRWTLVPYQSASRKIKQYSKTLSVGKIIRDLNSSLYIQHAMYQHHRCSDRRRSQIYSWSHHVSVAAKFLWCRRDGVQLNDAIMKF